jgi:hypothetical protein
MCLSIRAIFIACMVLRLRQPVSVPETAGYLFQERSFRAVGSRLRRLAWRAPLCHTPLHQGSVASLGKTKKALGPIEALETCRLPAVRACESVAPLLRVPMIPSADP